MTPWVSSYTMKFMVGYVPVTMMGMVSTGTGMVSQLLTHGIPVWNPSDRFVTSAAMSHNCDLHHHPHHSNINQLPTTATLSHAKWVDRWHCDTHCSITGTPVTHGPAPALASQNPNDWSNDRSHAAARVQAMESRRKEKGGGEERREERESGRTREPGDVLR